MKGDLAVPVPNLLLKHTPQIAEIPRGKKQVKWACLPSMGKRFHRLKLASSFHGLQHGDLIRIFDVTAHRNSDRDSRDLQPGATQLP